MAYIDIIVREDGNGKGFLFDHYVIRRTTGRLTRAVFLNPDINPEAFYAQVQGLLHAQYTFAFTLPPYIALSTEGNSNSNVICRNVFDLLADKDGELLFLPGAHQWERERTAVDAEVSTVFSAVKTLGRPLLAVCGRMLSLGAADNWVVANLTTHSAGRMLSLSLEGRIHYNTALHGVALKQDTVLHDIYTKWNHGQDFSEEEKLEFLHVNSVHSAQLYRPTLVTSTGIGEYITTPENTNGKYFTESARSLPGFKNGRCKDKPIADVIEAIESRWGAPMMGVQWHPEAYESPSTASSGPYNNDSPKPRSTAGELPLVEEDTGLPENVPTEGPSRISQG
ncbi:hypothetical protein BC829DRAFT_444842 [Chytridium lagenaria]|nr:hypothetical protein BC829DRAFT_444842 [Chytridium lagenaria]